MHYTKYTAAAKDGESNAESALLNQQNKLTSSLIQPANVLGKRANIDNDLEELIYGSTEKRKKQEAITLLNDQNQSSNTNQRN